MKNKPSKLLRLLSYLVEIPLEKSSGTINPLLKVTLDSGRIKLTTTNTQYSFEDLYETYKNAFEKLDASFAEIKKVLVLGLGLGSIPILLKKNFRRGHILLR